MSDIPRARELLKKLMKDLPKHQQSRMYYILRLMTREPAARRAPKKRRPKLTSNRMAEIATYVATHPREHLQDIAQKYGLGIGRVSEIINRRYSRAGARYESYQNRSPRAGYH